MKRATLSVAVHQYGVGLLVVPFVSVTQPVATVVMQRLSFNAAATRCVSCVQFQRQRLEEYCVERVIGRSTELRIGDRLRLGVQANRF